MRRRGLSRGGGLGGQWRCETPRATTYPHHPHVQGAAKTPTPIPLTLRRAGSSAKPQSVLTAAGAGNLEATSSGRGGPLPQWRCWQAAVGQVTLSLCPGARRIRQQHPTGFLPRCGAPTAHLLYNPGPSDATSCIPQVLPRTTNRHEVNVSDPLHPILGQCSRQHY